MSTSVRAKWLDEKILAGLPLGIVVLDDDLRPVYCNTAFQNIVGLAHRELEKKPINELIPAPDLWQALKNAAVNGVAHQLLSLPDAEQSFNVAFQKTAHGGREFYWLSFNDCTDHVRVKSFSRVQEALFHLLVDSLPDYAIFLLDTEGRIMTWNRGAERILGFAEAEILRQYYGLLFTQEDRDRDLPQRELENARLRGRYGEEGMKLRKDGSRIWVNELMTVLEDEQGRPRAFMKIIHDISERKAAEDQIRQLNSDLEQRVQQRTAELSMLNQELEAFSYSVSHDLRAPLRAIDGFSLALMEDYADRLDETGRQHLQRVRFASHRMAQLIDDLLELSRITRADMRLAEVDLSALARRIADDLRVADPGRTVEFVIAPDIKAHGDFRLLKIVLENLLRNAWKFTGKRDRARIEFSESRQAGKRVFFVRDDGAGFDMRYVGKLFTPFQRLHGANEFEGTGVGLATVQRIIHRHGGRIWAESAPGQGASFYFTLGENEPASPGSKASPNEARS